jgi:hypothetical protein
MVVAGEEELFEYTFRALIDLSPERARQVYEEHPDATLEELDEYSLAIEEEMEELRAGASFSIDEEAYRGQTTTISFDPLGRDKVWGKTPGGTYYVKAKTPGAAAPDAFVICVPSLTGEPGTYDLVMCSINETYNPRYDAAPPWARGTEHVGLHLDMALNWGEELAGDAFNTRKSRWRRAVPNAGQVKMARFKYGIEAGDMLAGELSEAMDEVQAARRIDPMMARMAARVKGTQE